MKNEGESVSFFLILALLKFYNLLSNDDFNHFLNFEANTKISFGLEDVSMLIFFVSVLQFFLKVCFNFSSSIEKF